MRPFVFLGLLLAVAPVAAQRRPPVVVVMPFDRATDTTPAIAATLADSLEARLRARRGLRVAHHPLPAGTPWQADTVGAANYLVGATMIWLRGTLRVDLQLFGLLDERPLWSATYRVASVPELFALADSMTAQVASVVLVDHRQRAPQSRPAN